MNSFFLGQGHFSLGAGKILDGTKASRKGTRPKYFKIEKAGGMLSNGSLDLLKKSIKILTNWPEFSLNNAQQW